MRGCTGWWDRKRSPGTKQDRSCPAKACVDIVARKFLERVYDETLKRLEQPAKGVCNEQLADNKENKQ